MIGGGGKGEVISVLRRRIWVTCVDYEIIQNLKVERYVLFGGKF